jgi:putative salt-induced outer membrane protein YdiY
VGQHALVLLIQFWYCFPLNKNTEIPRAEDGNLLGSVLSLFLGISVCTAGSDTGTTSGTQLPSTQTSGVERLPPVGNAEASSDWVSKPQFHDFLLDQDIKSSLEKKPRQGQSAPPPEHELEKPMKLWEGSFTLGLDGAEGNNQAMNLHTGFNAKRKTELHLLYLDLDYNRRNTNNVSTANRLFSQARYERLIPETPWSLFVETTGEYDEFQDFNFRITSHAGVGYWLFKTKQASLKTRFGSGFSHEIGGPKDNYYVPEMILGLDYERRVGDRQKLVATVDYMPDETDFTEFRLNSLAGWEFLLDQQTNLNLRLAVRNRYNSSPGTARPNDLDYAVLLLWKF